MGESLKVLPPVDLSLVSTEALIDEVIGRMDECIVICLRPPSPDDGEGPISFTCSRNYDMVARMCATAHANLWAYQQGLNPPTGGPPV
jgi:hypothetical protein